MPVFIQDMGLPCNRLIHTKIHVPETAACIHRSGLLQRRPFFPERISANIESMLLDIARFNAEQSLEQSYSATNCILSGSAPAERVRKNKWTVAEMGPVPEPQPELFFHAISQAVHVSPWTT
jgi:hypothetical protein